jgi:prepilin-type N-terminal cleavage/methylation domain-containing protein
MAADARRRAEREKGFTLIELLVVMIIIGVLAAIAIPVFLNQRAKAHDAATKADVTNLGKEVATYFVDNNGPLILSWGGSGRIDLTDGGYTTYARLTVGSRPPAPPTDSSNLSDPVGWCVALTDPKGSVKDFKYTALNGLQAGVCP